MTFKHKLSRRLALLRNVLVVGLVVLVACDLRALLQGLVVTVSVLPAASNIGVGQTLQLTATPRDANGNPISGRVVTWATNNAAIASVDANGLVTGATPGSATLTATSDGMYGTATATVAAAPPPPPPPPPPDPQRTRPNSPPAPTSYAPLCLQQKEHEASPGRRRARSAGRSPRRHHAA